MAALEIEGRIKQKLSRQSGQSARGAWEKQEFILEYQDGNYPADVMVTAFGSDKVADLDRYQVGDAVKVSFNLRAREYNGRWYNDVRLWKIAPAGQNAAQQPPVQQAPAPTLDDMPADIPENDLPF
ncbi:MAG: DUF3127 domain-containing protein [Bacteroidales bacterium]|jgi:hypothetical protein|nr:DUF3127 domain-containing protein [Bacteroidales bacterium]MEE3476038.1 DUF3127 domain-containing protein [Candidatus Cryptobacteroides sp.]MBQ2197550.1 DUF3127 domain-containing protein [Bacteroidales bacterium]MBQ2531599.1 DUF3127 domain-containing protein [Bacteroidales bacterium]MBQ5410583.1 DUF3127 domain-containing protein [Bacteroidales bacterium]